MFNTSDDWQGQVSVCVCDNKNRMGRKGMLYWRSLLQPHTHTSTHIHIPHGFLHQMWIWQENTHKLPLISVLWLQCTHRGCPVLGIAAVQRLVVWCCIKACCDCCHSTVNVRLSHSTPISSLSHTLTLSPTLSQSYFPLFFLLYILALCISCTLTGYHGDSCALQKSHWLENEIEEASLLYMNTHAGTLIRTHTHKYTTQSVLWHTHQLPLHTLLYILWMY